MPGNYVPEAMQRTGTVPHEASDAAYRQSLSRRWPLAGAAIDQALAVLEQLGADRRIREPDPRSPHRHLQAPQEIWPEANYGSVASCDRSEAIEKPAVSSGFPRADEGTRTLDLLHGKRPRPFAPVRASALKRRVCRDSRRRSRTAPNPNERRALPLLPQLASPWLAG